MGINKNSFSRNVLTLLTGTAFAQILPIVASPILTRLYSPQEFGELGLFIAILSILSILACMRYDLAIALPKSDKDAVNIFALSIIIAIVFSFVLLCLVLIFNLTPLNNFFEILSPAIIWLLPGAVLLLGLFQALVNWNIRTKDFKLIAITHFYRSSTIVSGQIGGGILLSGSLSLIVAQIVGLLIAFLKMGYNSFAGLRKYKMYINKQNMKKQLIRYKKFPLFFSWSALLNTASVQLPLFMLAFFFNPVIVGYYTLANRVLAAPISIVGNAIAQPYLQKAAEKHRENKLDEFSLQIFKLLLTIGSVPIIIIAIIAPELFGVIFGEGWSKSGTYVQLIAVWLLFVFISSPLSHVYTILELQKESLNFNIILFLSRIIVLIVGGVTGNDFFTIFLFGVTGAILWFFQITWLLNKTGIPGSTILKTLSKEILISIPFLLPLILFKILFERPLILLGISLLILLSFAFFRLKKVRN